MSTSRMESSSGETLMDIFRHELLRDIEFKSAN